MEYFIFNGIRSDSFDIVVKNKNAFNTSARDVTKQKIPGRNGNLIIDNGRYENIEIIYNCTLKSSSRINDIKNWLLFNPSSYIVLSDSYNPDTFRYASSGNMLQFTNLSFGIGDVDIAFDCKPFQYLVSGNNVITLNSSGNITNPTNYNSLPYIKITGSGNITLTINNIAYNLTAIDGYIEIESEIESAFKGSELQNNKMNSYPFPILRSGNNSISWSGNVASVAIVPRWCKL